MLLWGLSEFNIIHTKHLEQYLAPCRQLYKASFKYVILFFCTVVVVQPLRHIQLVAAPWTTACQVSLSFTIPQSLLKLMSIESVMPSNHLVLCCPFAPPAFNLSQHQGFFQWVSSLYQVAKVLELQLQHQSFHWIFALISFRMDWLDLLAVQATLKSLLQCLVCIDLLVQT